MIYVCSNLVILIQHVVLEYKHVIEHETVLDEKNSDWSEGEKNLTHKNHL